MIRLDGMATLCNSNPNLDPLCYNRQEESKSKKRGWNPSALSKENELLFGLRVQALACSA